MPFKCNFFFRNPATGGGWSETYYQQATDPTTIRTRMDSLAGARNGVLAGAVQIDYCRFSDENVNRDGFLFVPTATVSPFGVYSADYDFIAAEARMYTNLQTWRHLYARGVPDLILNPTTNAEKTAAANWFTAFNGYLTNLTSAGQGWQIKTFDRAQAQTLITDVTEFANSYLKWTTAAAHNLSIGNYVKFVAVRSPSPRLGVVPVVDPPTGSPAPGANEFWTRGTLPRGFMYDGKGFAQKWVASYGNITVADFIRVRHRDTGRPFGLARGRSSRARK